MRFGWEKGILGLVFCFCLVDGVLVFDGVEGDGEGGVSLVVEVVDVGLVGGLVDGLESLEVVEVRVFLKVDDCFLR